MPMTRPRGAGSSLFAASPWRCVTDGCFVYAEDELGSTHTRATFSWLQDVTLQAAFRDFGTVQNVKVIREKGGELGCRTVVFCGL